MKRAVAALTLGLFLVAGALAQAGAISSVAVQVNPGDFSWGTFIFGHGVDGKPGTTELIIQCDFKRAELITNFDVFGEQQTSQFFPVSCSEPALHAFVLNFPTDSDGNSQPLSETLTLTGRDSNGQPTSRDVSLTVYSANWKVTGFLGRLCFVTRACQVSGVSSINVQ